MLQIQIENAQNRVDPWLEMRQTVVGGQIATFGTQALSDGALAALDGRSACLLANHGMVVFGSDLRRALALAIEFETLCEQYWRACQIGAPSILSAGEMAEVIALFENYGQPRPATPPGDAGAA